MFLRPRTWPLMVATLMACTAMLSSHAGLSPGAATNLAGRQRMLSQRMTKAFLCQAFNINAAEAADELEKSRIQFETKLEILQASAFDAPVAEALRQEAAAWAAFSALLDQPPTRETALAVLEHNTPLLAACNTAVEKVVAYAQARPEAMADPRAVPATAGQDLAPLINLSGRQRMLSQRISAYYLAHLTDLQPAAIEEVFTAAGLFRDSLAILKASPANTPAITHALQLVENEWNTLLNNPERIRKREIPAGEFLAATTRILTSMDQLTLSYQQLAY